MVEQKGELQTWVEALLPLLPSADLLDDETLDTLYRRLVVERDFKHPDPQLERLYVLDEIKQLICFNLNQEGYQAANAEQKAMYEALNFNMGIDLYLSNFDDRAQYPIPEPLNALADALLHVEMIEAILGEIGMDGLLLLFVNNFGSRLLRWRDDLRRYDPSLAAIYDEAFALAFDKLQKDGHERDSAADRPDLDALITPDFDQQMCDLDERMEELRQASYLAAARHYRDALAACRDLVPAAIVGSIAAIRFEHPMQPKTANAAQLHRAIVAAGALGDTARARALIGRIHKPLVYADKESILWDMAVREASSLAAEGKLPQALAALEWWRGSAIPTPGDLESRMSGVCIAGGAYRAAMKYRNTGNELKEASPLLASDAALLQARFGSLELARSMLADVEQEELPDSVARFMPLIKGIIACRSRDNAAADLLAAGVMKLIDGAKKSPASWSLFGVCCSWWAIALDRSGKRAEAQRLMTLITPLLTYRYDSILIAALEECSLLPAGTPMSVAPEPAPEGETIAIPAPVLHDHGAFKTVCVSGVNALKAVEQYRRGFAEGSGLYPFLIGDANDLIQLKDMIDLPSDAGASHIAKARTVDVEAWLKKQGMEADAESTPEAEEFDDAAGSSARLKAPTSLYDLSGALKPEIHIGLIEADAPEEVFARLGYGNWNDCPAPHVHVALHAYWRKQFQAEPIAVSAGVVECVVGTPCNKLAAAQQLAGEQYAYCPDIVEQGAGSVGRLAAGLFGSRYWYFWWD